MKKRLALVVVGLVALLVAAGQLARAGIPAAHPPDDTNAWWTWDARELAYEHAVDGTRTPYVVPSGHGAAHPLPTPGTPRGWRPGGGGLLVDRGDGTIGVFAEDGAPIGTFFAGDTPTWSPDGGRVAYLREGVLAVSSATGGDVRTLGKVVRPSWDVAGPVWSPDGTRIAIATQDGLAVFEADGSGERVVFRGANQSVNPSWSADGERLAFERNNEPYWTIWVVGADGSAATPLTPASSNARLPQWSPVGDRLAFISDRQHVPGGATQYQFALYVERVGDARPAKLLDDVHPLTPPRWSPTAAQIADAAGQECRRWGIYVVRAHGAGNRRLSNACRFTGGARADVLRGTAYPDVMRGLGGNDRIAANQGDDRIEGNAGDDTIDPGPGNDAVFGGPGDDVVVQSAGDDLVVGGPGRDRIAAGAGNDRVEARDGSRDVIDCGPGIDTAEIDRLDVVHGCERVLRP